MQRGIQLSVGTSSMDTLIFTPDQADKALPGVILFTDIGGLRNSFYDKAKTIADAGYAVLLPNIYYRDDQGEVVPQGKSFRDDDVRPTLGAYAQNLTPQAQAEDFQALLSAIRDEDEFRTGPVAAVGYCMTGSFALRMAALHPQQVAAAASFHAANLAPPESGSGNAMLDTVTTGLLDQVANIEGRVYLGHADGDALLPPEQISRLDQALAAAGVDFTTELYKGAAHGFSAADAPAYDARADQRHYKRLFTLLTETL